MIDLGVEERLPQGSTNATGVVLKRRDVGAKSHDLLLLLHGIGAVWVTAPGAASSKNRFGGGIEPMVWSDLVLYQSPRRLYVKSADAREAFFSVRRSRARLTAAIAWHKLAALRIPLLLPNDQLMSLLYGSMKNLASGAPPSLCTARFLWRWANLWGTAPEMACCASCGAVPERGESFALASDGVLCPRCAASSPSPLPTAEASSLIVAQLAATVPQRELLSRAEELSSAADDGDMRRICAWLERSISG